MKLDLERLFPATSQCRYLNTGSVGLIPEPIREGVSALADRYYRLGPARTDVSRQQRGEFDRTRGRVAALLGAEENEVALLENTTAGINAVVHGLDLVPGDQVVVTDIEHPAGRITWEFLARSTGVEVVVVPARGGTVPAGDLVSAFTPRTRVLSISHVSWVTGAVLPVEDACREARKRGIFTVLDGAQGAGVMHFTPRGLGCDAYAYPGSKWTLGPEGTGVLWVDRDAWDRLKPYQISGRGAMTRNMDGDFDPWPGPRCFESSMVNHLAHITLGLSAEFVAGLGLDRISSHARSLARSFIDGLASIRGASVVTPRDSVAGLVSFQVEGHEPRDLAARLLENRGVVIRAVPRPAALRASFHLYNTVDDVQALLEALEAEAG